MRDVPYGKPRQIRQLEDGANVNDPSGHAMPPAALWHGCASPRWVVNRWQNPAHIREFVVLARVRELLFAAMQAALDDVNDLPSAAETFARRNAERLELVVFRAHADAEVKPALRNDIDRADVLGE